MNVIRLKIHLSKQIQNSTSTAVSMTGSGVLGLPKTYKPPQVMREFSSATLRASSLVDKLTGAATGLPRDDKPTEKSPKSERRDDKLSMNTFQTMMQASMKLSKPKQKSQADEAIDKKVAIKATAPQELEGQDLEAFNVLASKWEKRTKVRMSLSSVDYQRLQGRFLYIGVLPDLFEDQRDEAQWSYVTAHAYFTAGLAAIQAADVVVSTQLKLQAKLLAILAKEEDPRRQTIPAKAEHIIEAASKLSHSAALALQVTFVLGQRLGDVFKLQPQNVSTIKDELSQMILTTLTFKKGKTIGFTIPT